MIYSTYPILWKTVPVSDRGILWSGSTRRFASNRPCRGELLPKIIRFAWRYLEKRNVTPLIAMPLPIVPFSLIVHPLSIRWSSTRFSTWKNARRKFESTPPLSFSSRNGCLSVKGLIVRNICHFHVEKRPDLRRVEVCSVSLSKTEKTSAIFGVP